MNPPTDNPDRRLLAEAAVRDIARGTGFTTLAMIGEGDRHFYAVIDSVPPVDGHDLDYGLLLRLAADRERAQPTPLPLFACALVLPERDIAYLYDGETITTLMVGPNPVDDPGTTHTIGQGLAALMQVVRDNQPARRGAGRAFPNGAAPPPSERHQLPPFPTRPPPPGRDGHRGPHR